MNTDLVIVDVALYREGIRVPAPTDISDQVDIARAFALSGWVFFLFVYLGVWVGTKAKLHNL